MGRSIALLSLCLSVLCAASALAQRSWDQVVIRPERLADGVWMLGGAGGNMALCVGPDGALLVDAEYGQVADRIRAVVDSLAGGRPLRVVLNTHYHGDHVSGDSALAAHGAVIVAHENVYRRMSEEQHNAAFNATTPPYATLYRPTITFRDSMTFHLGALECRVAHVPPAHTDGDAIVRILPVDVLHTGDLFFNGTYPVIDVSAGGSLAGMIREADRLLALAGPATKIVPGHGPLADRAALARYRDMLVTVRERVTKLVRAGKSADEIVTARPLADLDAEWGRGFMKPEMFLRIVCADLSRGRAAGR
jgi:cyclase